MVLDSTPAQVNFFSIVEATGSVMESGWHGRGRFSGSNLSIDLHWKGDEKRLKHADLVAPCKPMLHRRAPRGDASLRPTGDVVRARYRLKRHVCRPSASTSTSKHQKANAERIPTSVILSKPRRHVTKSKLLGKTYPQTLPKVFEATCTELARNLTNAEVTKMPQQHLACCPVGASPALAKGCT